MEYSAFRRADAFAGNRLMVDTVRSLSALKTLLADNASGDISEQDARDFLVSVYRGSPSVLVAASDASQAAQDRADYLCTGTDDNEQIANAVADAVGVGFGTVELSEGTFNLGIEASTDCINFASNDGISLRGQGMGITTLKASVINWRSVIRGDQADYITLSDFTLDGNKSNFAGSPGIGIRFLSSAADHLWINRVEVKNTDGHAASITGSNVWVDACSIHDSDGGLQFNNDSSHIWVNNNEIYNIGTEWSLIVDGIYFGGQHFVAQGNTIHDCTDTGINLGGTAEPTGWAQLIDNKIYLIGNSGINTGGGENHTIIGNTIYACGRKDGTPRSNSGIRIRDDGGGTFTSNGIIVIGNRIYEDDTTHSLDVGALGMLNGIELVDAAGGGTPDNLTIIANDLRVVDAAPTGWTPVLRTDSGADLIIRHNLAEVTENSGTGSITSGGTTDVITHGLSVTPTAANISITPTENPTASVGVIWVDTITSTQFTVNCEVDPSTSNLDFGWQAVVI